jgi:hypothetical protein
VKLKAENGQCGRGLEVSGAVSQRKKLANVCARAHVGAAYGCLRLRASVPGTLVMHA